MRIRKLLGRTSEYGAAPLPRSPWVSSAPLLAAKEVENTDDREEEEMMAKVQEKKDEKLRLRRMKGIEETEENKRAGTKCKKTDGRGWHCKRDAQHPHTLCGYHLAQLRSYRSRVEEKVAGDGERCHRKQSAAAMEAGNYYYYYSILGPWWGKRRAPVDGRENPGFSDERNDKTDPGALDDDHEEDDEEDSEVAKKKKKKKPCKKKKRGRKPVKARSLKSLL